MATMFGMTPEPMSISDQSRMALITIGKQILNAEDITPFQGPVLSSNQLETWICGYQTAGEARLIFSWDPENEELITDLIDSEEKGCLELSVELMPAESLVSLASGGRIGPATLLKRRDPCVGYSHGMNSFSLRELFQAATDWFRQSRDAQCWNHEMTMENLNEIGMGNLVPGWVLSLFRDGSGEVTSPSGESVYWSGMAKELSPGFAPPDRKLSTLKSLSI